MSRIIRAVFDEQGYPLGFYPSDVWPTGYPDDAVEISEAQWQELLSANTKRWYKGEVVEAPPRPSPPMTADEEEESKEIAKQYLEMHSLIARTILAWSSIETELARLLSSIIGGTCGHDQQVAFAILFSPPGLDAKIKIVKDAFTALALRAVDTPAHHAALEQWANLEKALKSAKRTRNTVAHGSIVTAAKQWKDSGAFKNYVRLTPNIFDMNRMDLSALSCNTLPGLSVSDIRQSLERLSSINQIIEDLRQTAGGLRLGTFRAPTE